MNILVNTSLGELVDKITILEIKYDNMTDKDKLANVKKELAILTEILAKLDLAVEKLAPHKNALKEINAELWKIEDDIRDKERQQEFDEKFIELARAVYFTNDQRAMVKKTINVEFGSALVEEKSYQAY